MTENPAQDMTVDECWQRLAATPFGRIATAAAGEVTITPFNYVVDDHRLVFRTAPGTKLADLVVSNSVAVEIDDVQGSSAWSVIARGTARMAETSDEREHLDTLGLKPWVDSEKDVFVVVDVDEVTGRTFRLSR